MVSPLSSKKRVLSKSKRHQGSAGVARSSVVGAEQLLARVSQRVTLSSWCWSWSRSWWSWWSFGRRLQLRCEGIHQVVRWVPWRSERRIGACMLMSNMTKQRRAVVEIGEATSSQPQKRMRLPNVCEQTGSTKLARGSTHFCAAHGRGKRCLEPRCTKSARGSTNYCVAHGGGKRCREPGCTNAAVGPAFCIAHGGGKRCREPGCVKGAQGSTNYCKAHGGGKRCQEPGCTKSAIGSTNYCRAHGGGKRCREPECTKVRKDPPTTASHTAAASAVGNWGARSRRMGPPTTASLTVAASAVEHRSAPRVRRIHQLLQSPRRRQALSRNRSAPSRR